VRAYARAGPGGGGRSALELGTLLGLLLAVTRGLFGFVESPSAPLFWPSVYVEVAGAGVLAALALATATRTPAGAVRPNQLPEARDGAGTAASRGAAR
jgi:hypothetical protein